MERVHYWNGQRQKIYDWMATNGLESYAQLYKGAVVNLYEKTPGYVRFVAHAVRDMTNGMAAYKLGRERSQVPYVHLVGDLQMQWLAEKLPAGSETLTPDETPDHLAASQKLEISSEVTAKIQYLLGKHEEGRRRSEESPFLFFEAFLPNQVARKQIPQAHREMWKELQNWFRSHCHENGKLPSTEVTSRIEEQFNKLEKIILTVADRFTNTIKNVDEILDKANS
jgi:hypothetical protein